MAVQFNLDERIGVMLGDPWSLGKVRSSILAPFEALDIMVR